MAQGNDAGNSRSSDSDSTIEACTVGPSPACGHRMSSRSVSNCCSTSRRMGLGMTVDDSFVLHVRSGAHQNSCHVSREPNSEGASYLQYGVEARLGSRSQCLVQALASEASIFGNLRHATSASYVAKGQQQEIRIVCFENGGHVFRNCRIVVEVARCVEGKQLGRSLGPAHGSNSSCLRIRWARLMSLS